MFKQICYISPFFSVYAVATDTPEKVRNPLDELQVNRNGSEENYQ
jgi:hypothetical protein